jgi:CRISPR/Cas system CSM-associated protein Csm2 small subunit
MSFLEQRVAELEAKDLTPAMEDAGMDEARQQFGHGVTRTSIRRIYYAMISKRDQDDNEQNQEESL